MTRTTEFPRKQKLDILVCQADFLKQCMYTVTTRKDQLKHSTAYETEDSMPHSQGFSNNPYPESNQSISS